MHCDSPEAFIQKLVRQGYNLHEDIYKWHECVLLYLKTWVSGNNSLCIWSDGCVPDLITTIL